MGDIVFNVALGRVAHYASQVDGAGNEALIVVPLESAALVTDATMRDYTTLAAVLAGASNEQTTMGRKTITTCAVTVNNTDDRVEIDFADQSWPGASGSQVGALLVCFDADTTSGSDTNIIPLTKHDWPIIPDGSEVVLTVSDFYRASSAA